MSWNNRRAAISRRRSADHVPSADQVVIRNELSARSSRPSIWAFGVAFLVLIHLAIIPEKNIYGKGTHSFLPIAVADKYTTGGILLTSVLALLLLPKAKSRLGIAILMPATLLTLGFVQSLSDGGSSVVALFSYLLIATAGALSGYFLSKHDPEWVRIILIMAALAGAGTALYQFFMDTTYPYTMTGLRGFNDITGERVNRALGLTGEPLSTATVSMAGLLCTAGWKPRAFGLWLTRVILVGGLAVTFSRGSLFAGLLGAFLLILLSQRSRMSTKLLQLGTISFGVWLAIASIPTIAVRVLRTNDASYTVRAGVISDLEAAIAARIFDPIFGSGAGTNVSIRTFFGTPLDNGYLDILVNWGLVGIGAMAICVITSRRLIGTSVQYMFVALLAIMASGITYEFTHYSSAGFLFFFTMAACQGAYEKIRDDVETRTLRRNSNTGFSRARLRKQDH